METPLHAQKVAILSRLVKESSLTLEEALLLLKPEEEEEEILTNQQVPVNYPYGNYIYTPALSTLPLTGTGTTISGSISVTNNTTTHADL
jgi:hypothetical protein